MQIWKNKKFFKPLVKTFLAAGLGILLGSEGLNAALPSNRLENDSAYLNKDIVIDEKTFPDPAFRNWLLQKENLNGIGADGRLTPAEIKSCNGIVMQRQGVTDLTGINYFTALRFLDVEGNYITKVDISKLIELEIVYLRTNLLRMVDLSHNKKLKFIEIFDNQLESIDVSMLSELEFLHIDHNKLTTIDMSHNFKLQDGGFIVRNQPDLRTVKLPVIPGSSISADNFYEQDPRPGYSTWKWQYQGEPEREIHPTDVLPFDGSTLEVVREPNPYRINFDPGAKGVKGTVRSIDTTWDKDVVLPAAEYQREGYSFMGWRLPNTQVIRAGEIVRNIGGRNDYNKNVTLTAVWKAEEKNKDNTEEKSEDKTDNQNGQPGDGDKIDGKDDQTEGKEGKPDREDDKTEGKDGNIDGKDTPPNNGDKTGETVESLPQPELEFPIGNVINGAEAIWANITNYCSNCEYTLKVLDENKRDSTDKFNLSLQKDTIKIAVKDLENGPATSYYRLEVAVIRSETPGRESADLEKIAVLSKENQGLFQVNLERYREEKRQSEAEAKAKQQAEEKWQKEYLERRIALAKAQAQLGYLDLSPQEIQGYEAMLAASEIGQYELILKQAREKSKAHRKATLGLNKNKRII